MTAVEAEILIRCQQYRIWERFGHANETGIREAHRNAGVAFSAVLGTRERSNRSGKTWPRSEAGGARGGGTHFGGVDAETEMSEVRLAEGHEAGVEVAPDKEEEKRDGGVIFVGEGVHDSG